MSRFTALLVSALLALTACSASIEEGELIDVGSSAIRACIKVTNGREVTYGFDVIRLQPDAGTVSIVQVTPVETQGMRLVESYVVPAEHDLVGVGEDIPRPPNASDLVGLRLTHKLGNQNTVFVFRIDPGVETATSRLRLEYETENGTRFLQELGGTYQARRKKCS